jgi:putative selenium metabolism protein SsnA
MSLLVTNGQVFTLGAANELIAGGAVHIEGDTIAEVGKTADLVAKHPHAERIDVGGKLVLPGMLCGHTHFYGAFARGMAIPGTPAVNFVEILEKLWWSLDLALLDEDVRYSALIFLVDAIKHGCTTMIDHHASPNAIDGSLDIIGEAVKEAGLRASLCYEVTDRNGMDGAAAGIRENVRWLKKRQQARDPQLAGSFGLHAALTLSDETLENCAAVAQGLNTGFHIHVAEDAADQTESVRKYNLRVVERLQKFGILGSKSITVHCVHLDEFEKDMLRETGTHVTHQPRSNMNNAVGLPDVTGMLARGIPVALGNDGFSMFMVDEMKACYLAHKHNTRDPRTMPGDVVLQMQYANNADLAKVFFPKPVGEIAPGAFGDLVVWDYHPPTPLSPGNLPWHILFGVDAAVVTHTIASGKVLMQDRQLTFLDEAAIMARARELGVEVWKRVG